MLPIALPLPIPFATRTVNAYLLPGEPLTIVDPGADTDEAATALETALAHHGLKPADVEQILITHQHLDHAGFAHRLQECSGASVVAHHQVVAHLAGLGWASMEAEDRFQSEVMGLHGSPESETRHLYEISKASRRYGGSLTVDAPVREGDVIEAGGGRLVVHERPGHSPSDLVFADEEGRFALVGDHLIAGISPNPLIHRPLDRPADPRDRPQALVAFLESMGRTATLSFDVGLSGHGPPVDDHVQLIRDRVEFHERRKDRVLETFAGSGRTAREIARALWGEVSDREPFLTLSETLGHLDLLEAERLVAPYEEDGLIRYVPS
jgi:glyoxylase-like metal-dependent hydrolase (beta-lactamase superfamily II)